MLTIQQNNKTYAVKTQEQDSVTHYYKYVDERWQQPLITSDGVLGGNSFAVSGSYLSFTTIGTVWGAYSPRGTAAGNQYWGAFCTTSGYTAPYYVGHYSDADRGGTPIPWIILVMYNPIPLKITQFSYYIPGINTNSDWGSSITQTQLWGSNRNIASIGSAQYANDNYWDACLYADGIVRSRFQTAVCTCSNTGYFNYYKCLLWGNRSSHHDEVDVSSFRITAYTKTAIGQGSANDYDFYSTTYNSSLCEVI